MFGPDIASMAKQVVVRCDGRFSERYEWLLEQIQIWGAKIYWRYLPRFIVWN